MAMPRRWSELIIGVDLDRDGKPYLICSDEKCDHVGQQCRIASTENMTASEFVYRIKQHSLKYNNDRDEKCTCGHERGVHAGHDGLGRCALRSCPRICGKFVRVTAV